MIAELAHSDASRRRTRIHLLLDTMVETSEKLVVFITEAKEKDDHLALGFPSWAKYVSVEYTDALSRLDTEGRRIASLALSQTGMSSRAIAPIVGASQTTVVRDLQVNHNGSPEPKVYPEDVVHSVDPLDKALMEISKITSVLPANVVGVDGKSYVRPVRRPRKIRRTPLPDQYRDAVYDLGKAVRRLEKLTADNRFTANRDAITARHRGELATYSKTLWQARGALGDGVTE